MTNLGNRLLCLLAAGALLGPSVTLAQSTPDKKAIVISSFAIAADPVSRDVREDALAVSEALLGLGYNVRRFENPEPAMLQDAIAAADGSDLVFYYAGTEAELLPQITDAVSSVTTNTAAIFLDVCRAELVLNDDLTAAWSLPETLPDNIFLAASVAPEVPCGVSVGPVADRLLEGLGVPGLTLDLAFAQTEDDGTPVWTKTTLATPIVFRQPVSDMRLTAEDYALLDSLPEEKRAQMIALWTQAGITLDRTGLVALAPVQRVVEDNIVLSAPVQPVRTSAMVILPRSANTQGAVSDGISVIAAAPVDDGRNRAVPGVGGLPAPSIIVGLIAQDASFGTVTQDGGSLTGSEFDYTNVDARRAMREQDPTLFASLIETGAFDPPPSELVFAIQSELTRMACYDRGIDGRWGPGSEAGLQRYFDEAETEPDTLEPTLPAFRQMLVRDDVTCPVVAVAAPRPAATPTATAPRPQQTAATPAAPRPAPAPAPAAENTRTFNSNSGITGVFR